MPDNPNNVARPRLIHRFPILPEQPMGTRQANPFAGAGDHHAHLALKPPRANADERNAIAMARVHVRLDLKNESAERRIARLDHSMSRRPRLRWQAITHKRIQQELHAKVIHRRAEEDRRELPAMDRLFVKHRARPFQERKFLHGGSECFRRHLILHPRFMQIAHLFRARYAPPLVRWKKWACLSCRE